METSELEQRVRSQTRVRREAGEAVIAEHLASVILAGYRWARLNPQEADLSAALGRNMYGMIRWVSRAFNLSEEIGVGFESKETKVLAKPGDATSQVAKGRIVSESVPPCWSPRWANERAMLRTYSPAETFEAELLNTINDQIDLVDAGVEAALATQKKMHEPRNIERAITLQKPGLEKRLLASVRLTSNRMKELEKIAEREVKEMEALLKLTAEARDKGWQLLNRAKVPRAPKTPQQQRKAVGDWLSSDGQAADDDDDDDDGSDIDWQEYLASNEKSRTAKKNPYIVNGRYTYGR